MPPRVFRQSRRPQEASVPLGPFTQGVNERTEPHLLEFSEASGGQNFIADDFKGRLRKRPGTVFKAAVPHLIDPPRRAFTFVKRDGTEILIVTDNKKLVATEDLVNWTNITPTTFLTGGSFVGGFFYIDFAVRSDKVIITNGADPVFSWDGNVANPLVAYDKTVQVTIDGADTATAITDVLLDRAGVNSWLGQVLVVTQAVDPTLIGLTRVITSFVDATDTIGFASLPGLVAGDKVRVGVNIPRGRYVKHDLGTVFMACTPDNTEEVRFTDTVDPNQPTLSIDFDHPLAWPQVLQLEIGSGGRLWGFTPSFRGRFAVMKQDGLHRIDPDPTFRFLPVTITNQIGSRFNLSWQQHKNALIFLGEDRDGKVDVYMTDFASVDHFNRKHANTLDDLQQPNAVEKTRLLSSQADFDGGVKSSLLDTSGGDIAVKKMDSEAEWDAVAQNPSTIDRETDPELVSLLGFPDWTNAFDGVALPPTYGWSQIYFETNPEANYTETNVAGDYWMELGRGAFSAPITDAFLKNFKTLASDVGAKDILARCRFKWVSYPNAGFDANNNVYGFATVRNGSKQVDITFTKTKIKINAQEHSGFDFTAGYTELVINLRSDGTYKVWKDNVLLQSGTGSPDVRKEVVMGIRAEQLGTFDSAAGHLLAFDFYNTHEDFKSSALLPDTLLESGSFEIKTSFVRPPARFGRQFVQTVLNGGTMSFQSQSSADDLTYSALAALTSGQEPAVDNATPLAKFLRLKVALARAALTDGKSVHVSSYVGGAQYWSPSLSVGAEIKAWNLLQFDVSSLPALANARVRIATPASLGVLTEPDEDGTAGWDLGRAGADAYGFLPIANLGNIGTALGGAEAAPNPPFPEARFVQFEFELGLNAHDQVHGISSLLASWIEGSADILPYGSTILNKKWLFTCASSASAKNDTIVVVDSERGFVNWKGLEFNFPVWFRGKLLFCSAIRKELVEMVEGLLQDDDGPGVGPARLTKAIDAYVDTKQEIGGAIHQRKKARSVEIAGHPTIASMAISTRRDEEAAFVALGTVQFTASKSHQRVNVPAGRQFKRIILRARNAVINEDLPLEGMVFNYEVIPSRGGQ